MSKKDEFHIRFGPEAPWLHWPAESVAGFVPIFKNVMQDVPNEHVDLVNIFGGNYFAIDGAWLDKWDLSHPGVFLFYAIHVPGGTIYDADHPGVALSNWEFRGRKKECE